VDPAETRPSFGIDVPSLAGTELLDEAGVGVPASQLWAKEPAVLVFVRHFGCMFCREQTAQLQPHESEITDAGARLIVVGNGQPRFVADFRRTTGFEGLLYTDPTRAAYRACAFNRGVGATVNPTTAKNAVRAMRAGFRQGRTQGDPWQQGGVVAIAPGDEVLWIERVRRAGDTVDLDAVLAPLLSSR
jgi:peroxiredoxin